jgi:hypothetical protein
MSTSKQSPRYKKVAPPRFGPTDDHLDDVLFGSKNGATFIATNFVEEVDKSA